MIVDEKRRMALKGMGSLWAMSAFGVSLNANEVKSKEKLLVLVSREKENFLDGLNETKVYDKVVREVDFAGNFSDSRKILEKEFINGDAKKVVGILDNASFIILSELLKGHNNTMEMQIFHNTAGEKLTHMANANGLSKSFFNTTTSLLKDENWSYMIGYALGSGDFSQSFFRKSNSQKVESFTKKDVKLVSFIIQKKEITNV